MNAQALVNDVMSTPVRSVGGETPLQEAVQLMSDNHISGLPVLDGAGKLVGELTEQQLMVRESGLDTGPYVMLLDAVIYLRNPLNWDRQVHQVQAVEARAFRRGRAAGPDGGVEGQVLLQPGQRRGRQRVGFQVVCRLVQRQQQARQRGQLRHAQAPASTLATGAGRRR